ncbi:MAG: T9SS type A sorting domain-containing protein [Aequorivita antarctica]
MKKTLVLMALIFLNSIIGQNYDVTLYEKIGYEVGGFGDGLENEDWFGFSVEGIGDLNGDGINDIAVSAIKDDDGGFNHGAVYILFLNLEGYVASYQKISDTEGGFEGQLDEWDIFGTSLSYLGDMNNDGLIELGVGAEYDGDGGYWHGAAWILSLNPDGTVNSYVKISDTEGGFNAPLDDEDVFGTDIESIGDLDGDGFQDIAVSARRDPDGGSDRGAVYILFLNVDFTVKNYQKISDTQGGLNGVLEAGDYFGGSVANIGDLNGDGIIDLAVGAYRDDDGGLNRGAVYILFMNTDGTVNNLQKISDIIGNFDTEFNDEMFFGKSIDLMGDLNGDELIEIAVGARGYQEDGALNFGAFYILNLNVDGTVNSYIKYTEGLQYFEGDIDEGDSFGFSVSNIGRLTENNCIAIGAFSDNEGGFEKGSVWVLQLGTILSIEEIDNGSNSFFLYPNPSKNSFSLNDTEGISKIQIFDINGRLVVNYDNLDLNIFNVSYLPVGEYVVKISLENGNLRSFKLIKQ